MKHRWQRAREEKLHSCFPDIGLPAILTASRDQLEARRKLALEVLDGRPVEDVAQEHGIPMASVRRIVRAECRAADPGLYSRIGGFGAGFDVICGAFAETVKDLSAQD